MFRYLSAHFSLALRFGLCSFAIVLGTERTGDEVT